MVNHLPYIFATIECLGYFKFEYSWGRGSDVQTTFKSAFSNQGHRVQSIILRPRRNLSFFFESFLGTYADDKDTTVTYHQQPYQQADITLDQHFDAIMSMLMGYLYIYTTSNTSLTT